MKTIHRLIASVLLLMIASAVEARPKLVTIRLTGTSYEDIEMTIGNTGRTEIISMLPYEFKLSQDELPVRLKFRSENYQYYQIDIPTKPYDDCGHVYLLKINESAQTSITRTNQQPAEQH